MRTASEIAREIEKFIDSCPFSEEDGDLLPLVLRALADEYEGRLFSARPLKNADQ
jgi:hypothetical protein